MKAIKMMLYGEPGVGKSVFASKAPKPFFITTDGNYEWLEDFGAKPEDHKQVSSWEEAKKAFAEDYNDYETIVVDLTEDLFKWCEHEFCLRSRLEHISDVGYGKGYDITRNEFFLEISKLLGKPKHIILISHGITFVTKDRRGVEHTKHAPSSRIPDKVLDMIEGRLRYCLRCYLKAEETENGEIVKRRYLSLVPKENEFGIARGIDESKTPHDIPLDWNIFAKAVGLDNNVANENIVKVETKVIEKAKETIIENVVEYAKDNNTTVNEIIKTDVEVKTTDELEGKTVSVTEVNPMPFDEPKVEPVQETKVETINNEPVEERPKAEPAKSISNADKLAAIKAKLEAMRNAK